MVEIERFRLSVQYGAPPRNESKVYETQARNLIDRIFSTPHMQLLKPINGVSMEYMRNVMHRVGDKYGFIETSLAFKIEMHFTVARVYTEKAYRGANQCSMPAAGYGMYSGFPGDTGPSGSFIDWKKIKWKKGRPRPSAPLPLCPSGTPHPHNHTFPLPLRLYPPSRPPPL